MPPPPHPPRLVLHVVHRFAVGGLENGIVNLINTMPAERWSHAVVALTEVDPAFAARLKRDDVRCFALHKPPGQGLRLYPRFFSLLRELRPQVVHTRNLGTLEFQVPAWAARVPARVHGEHGRDADDVQGTNRRHIALRRLYRPLVHQQIALGSELRGYLQHKIGVPGERLHLILNGVDIERFAPVSAAAAGRDRPPPEGYPFEPGRHWVFGAVGRMATVKAQTDLARAFVALLQQRPAWRERLRLVMVGDGPLRAESRQILERAGMAELAWLPGERADVPNVMRLFDCFVLPSWVEGISNTILEAMASSLPVVACDVGGNRDLVSPGITGTLVPAKDPRALAVAMADLAADPARAASWGHAGRAAVEQRFSMRAMVAAYEAVYERALARR